MKTKVVEIAIDVQNDEVSILFVNCESEVFCAKIALNVLQKFLKDNDTL